MKTRRGYKRGHPVAVLVGFEYDRALLWQIFSYVTKPLATLKLSGRRADDRVLYTFHEAVVDALRPVLKEGVRSIILATPAKTGYAAGFVDHVRKHHAYLIQPGNPNRANFAELVGSADQPHKVAELAKTKEFRKLIAETTSEEADHIVDTFDKYLYTSGGNQAAMFSLVEIEEAIYNRENHRDLRTRYLMLTDEYVANTEYKNRINRLLQIANNRNVKTRIVKAETPAGRRISQFGGLVFFTAPNK